MKVGMTVEPFKGMSLEQVVRLLKMINTEHIEVNYTIMSRINELTKGIGDITTTFHLPIQSRFKFDMGSINKFAFQKQKEVIKFLNENKVEMNLKYVLTHPPQHETSSWIIMFENLSQIESDIVIENIQGQTDEEFIEFYFIAKDYLGKQLAGHAIDAPHRYVTDWRTWLKIPKELLKEIVYVHISDCSRTKDDHLPLGLGSMPFEDFFQKLIDINYDGIILNEILPHGGFVTEILDSYLHSIKPFSKKKYLKLRMKYLILKPLIQFSINTFYKNFKDQFDGIITKDTALEVFAY